MICGRTEYYKSVNAHIYYRHPIITVILRFDHIRNTVQIISLGTIRICNMVQRGIMCVKFRNLQVEV